MTEITDTLTPLLLGMAGGCLSGAVMFYAGKWHTLKLIGERLLELSKHQAEFSDAVASQCESLGSIDRIMLDMLSKHEARIHDLEHDQGMEPVGVVEYEN